MSGLALDGPRDLAEKIRRSWEEDWDKAWRPDWAAFETTLSQAYRMSMIPDEGRYPTLWLFFPYSPAEVKVRLVPLGPAAVRLARVAHIAHAIAPPPYALVVDAFTPILTCLGVAPTQDGSGRHFQGLYVAIMGPGTLQVTLRDSGGNKSWRLSQCRARRVPELRESPTIATLAQAAATVAGDVLEETVTSALLDLARKTCAKGHGACFLVTPSDATSDPHLSISHRLPTEADAIQLVPYPEAPGGRGALNDRLDLVAQLGQVDGCVVLSPALKLVGFGAMISLGDSATSEVVDSSTDESMSLEDLGHGARHRSAAWHVSQTSGATALVVSEDGGVTVFAHHRPGVAKVDGPYLL